MALLGRTLDYAGRPEEGFSLIQTGIRLSPYTNPNVLRMEGLAYYSMGLYEEAIAAFERARARSFRWSCLSCRYSTPELLRHSGLNPGKSDLYEFSWPDKALSPRPVRRGLLLCACVLWKDVTPV